MLVEALERLEGVRDRGYTFVSSDGSERVLPFQELIAEARMRGAALRERGLERGDRVALLLPEPDQFLGTFLGAALEGIVPVPMYPPLALGSLRQYARTLGGILAKARPKWMVLSDALGERLEAELELPPRVDPSELWAEVGSHRPARPAGEDLCFLQFTSGSTAAPKGVMVRHANLAANAKAMMVDALRITPQDHGLSWLPMYHDMGLIGKALAPLFIGTPVTIFPTAAFLKRPRLWMAEASRRKATVTFAPCFAFRLALRRATPKFVAELDLSALRVVGCGAEPIHAPTLAAFAEAFRPAGLDPGALTPCYGMAEATLAVSFSPLGRGLRRLRIDRGAYQERRVAPAQAESDGEAMEVVSCGPVVREHEVAVFDESGAALGEGRVGEIAFRGPSVTAGYEGDDAETNRRFREGWLCTGDVGFVEDGEVYVTGRVKDLIIVNGRNHDPQAIEWAVEEDPEVRLGGAAAVSVLVDGSERVVLLAEARSPGEDLSKRLAARVRDAMGLTLDEVALLAPRSLPKTSSGKVCRAEAKRLFETGAFE